MAARPRDPAPSGVEASDLDETQLVDFAHELGHQLSVGIENVQLLEEILRQRRLLEDTFKPPVDLIVVTDRDLKIVQANDAFALRAGVARPETIGRPLRNFVAGETALWVETADATAGPPPIGTPSIDDARLGGNFSATATPLINHEREPFGSVLVARDLTPRPSWRPSARSCAGGSRSPRSSRRSGSSWPASPTS